jgi:putative transposase
LFHAWLNQVYHQRVHSETGQTPAARYHHRADDAPQPRRPGTQALWRAFLWRETRTVTSWRAVSLLGNHYEVDAALVGYDVDLLFNPFDLERIDVEYHGRPMGQARPHEVTRHVHPDVKATTKKPPAQATGIDYLRLLEKAQQAELGQAIRFDLLADTATEPSTHTRQAPTPSPATMSNRSDPARRQRQATQLLDQILHDHPDLPIIDWTVGQHGLHAHFYLCDVDPYDEREAFTAWVTALDLTHGHSILAINEIRTHRLIDDVLVILTATVHPY